MTPPTEVAYEADSLPEDNSDAPWELLLNQTTPPEYHSDGQVLFLNGYDIYLDSAQENDGYYFHRSEPELATATKYALEVRVHIIQGRYPMEGPFDAAYVAYGVIDDGQRRVAAITGPDPTLGELLLIGSEQVFSAPCAHWFVPTTYRLVVDKTSPDPTQHQVEVYADDVFCMSVPYQALAGSQGWQPGVYFGGRDSDSVWDHVTYEICPGQPALVILPLQDQIEAMHQEVSAIAAPRWVRNWLETCLERIARFDEPQQQDRGLHRIGRHVFTLKRIGIIGDDVARLETMLEFGRRTVISQVGRVDGYRGLIHLDLAALTSNSIVPNENGGMDMNLLARVDTQRGSFSPPTLGTNSLLVRYAVVESASGSILRTDARLIDLPEEDATGVGPFTLPISVTWDGNDDEGVPVLDRPLGSGLFINITVEYVVVDPEENSIERYRDNASFGIDISGGYSSYSLRAAQCSVISLFYSIWITNCCKVTFFYHYDSCFPWETELLFEVHCGWCNTTGPKP